MALPTRIATLLMVVVTIFLMGGAVTHAHAPAQDVHHGQAAFELPAEHGDHHWGPNCCHMTGAHCASPAGVLSQGPAYSELARPLAAALLVEQSPRASAPAILPKPPRV